MYAYEYIYIVAESVIASFLRQIIVIIIMVCCMNASNITPAWVTNEISVEPSHNMFSCAQPITWPFSLCNSHSYQLE